MSLISRLLRGNAHGLNFLLFGTAIVAPVLYYASKAGPTPEHVEAVLNETYGDKVAKSRNTTEKINSFWKAKRNASEMDEIYGDLLRSGKSSVKRHYELSGNLAAEEAKQDPNYAHVRAILTVPPAEEKEKESAKAPSKDSKASADSTAKSATVNSAAPPAAKKAPKAAVPAEGKAPAAASAP